MPAPIALPDEVYFRLVDDLLHARDEFRIMELIGGVTNIWPQSTLPMQESKHHDNQITATPELGDRVRKTATAPGKLASKATEAPGYTPLVWPPCKPRSVECGAINPPWLTPK